MEILANLVLRQRIQINVVWNINHEAVRVQLVDFLSKAEDGIEGQT